MGLVWYLSNHTCHLVRANGSGGSAWRWQDALGSHRQTPCNSRWVDFWRSCILLFLQLSFSILGLSDYIIWWSNNENYFFVFFKGWFPASEIMWRQTWHKKWKQLSHKCWPTPWLGPFFLALETLNPNMFTVFWRALGQMLRSTTKLNVKCDPFLSLVFEKWKLPLWYTATYLCSPCVVLISTALPTSQMPGWCQNGKKISRKILSHQPCSNNTTEPLAFSTFAESWATLHMNRI